MKIGGNENPGLPRPGGTGAAGGAGGPTPAVPAKPDAGLPTTGPGGPTGVPSKPGPTDSAGAVSGPLSRTALWDRVLGSEVHRLLRPASASASSAGGAALPAALVAETRTALGNLLRVPAPSLREALQGVPPRTTPAQAHATWTLQRETLWTSMGTSFTIQGGRLVITMYSYGAGGVVVGYVVDEVIQLARRGNLDGAVRAWDRLGPEFFRREDVPRVVGHVLRRTVVEGHRAFGAFVSRLETWIDSILPQLENRPRSGAGGRGDAGEPGALTAEDLQPWLDEFELLLRQHPEDALHLAHLGQRFLEVAAASIVPDEAI